MGNKNILVTGGAGFIGDHLVSSLLANRYNVTVVDHHKPRNTNLTYHQIDFADTKALMPILEKHDAVFHLAAMVGVDRCRLHPDEVMKINYQETKHFIDLCTNTNIKHFFFTSSSEVYGYSKNIPYREDAELQPLSVYGLTKALTEQYLKSIHREKGLKVSIVRLFNVYGPRQEPNFVIPIFIGRALRGEKITIIGDGTQTRCFTYVKDATEGMLRLFETNKSGYEIVNIGNKKEMLSQTTGRYYPAIVIGLTINN